MWLTFIISLQCNNLLETLGSAIHLEASWHRNTIVDQVDPAIAMAHPDGSGHPSRTMCPITPQELLRKGLRNKTKSPRLWPALQIPFIKGSTIKSWCHPQMSYDHALCGQHDLRLSPSPDRKNPLDHFILQDIKFTPCAHFACLFQQPTTTTTTTSNKLHMWK